MADADREDHGHSHNADGSELFVWQAQEPGTETWDTIEYVVPASAAPGLSSGPMPLSFRAFGWALAYQRAAEMRGQELGRRVRLGRFTLAETWPGGADADTPVAEQG